MSKNFTHIHVHTRYSFLDGMASATELAKIAKELGMTSLAITDHNHLGGVYEFQEACKAEGIKPLLGCEMYYTEDTNILSLSADERNALAMEKAVEAGVEIPAKIDGKKITKKQINELIADYTYDTKQYHILFIATNQLGWKNLVQLQSEAAAKCTYNGRYLCDLDMIRKYSEGLIMTTACIGSRIAHLINHNKEQEAEILMLKFKDIFGDRFFLEIQPLNIIEQQRVNATFMTWSEKYNIKLIATNDVHYGRKADHDDHDTLLCIGTGNFKIEQERIRYSNDFWMKSYDEMVECFTEQCTSYHGEYNEAYMAHCIKALENTNALADMVDDNIKLGSDVDLFPQLDIPNNMEPETYLTMLCYKNLYKYKKKRSIIPLRAYEARLDEELHIINSKGFAPYILTVYEYVNWCDQQKIPVGPGRGSAAGSLILFLLGITKVIDPIEYDLLFFRFLTMDRTAPPDIDLDFSYFRRDDVIRHLEDKYGANKVCHIGTYTTMGVKSGLKDVGRVLQIDFVTMNSITKEIDIITDEAPSIKFKHLDALAESDLPRDKAKYEQFKALENKYPELFRLARRFEGTPRNMGVHASGILITPMPVADLFPTRVDPKTGVTVALYTGPQLESLKAIKVDILGLKTLDVLDMTAKSIDPNSNLEDYYDIVKTDDKKMFDLIKAKATDGLFQIESPLFKGLCDSIQPDNIDDIIAITSIGRPGPLSAGMDKMYADRKHGREQAVEPLPNTWDLVSNTYGTIIYQEAIMLIAQRVAGFNGNQADSYLRKGFAKKKKALMDMCKQWFIYGKKNIEAPVGTDETNLDQPMYDPTGKHGTEIKGGIANGYDEQQLKDFWHNIEGFADYLFNKSHAACYSYITVLTAYFKTYYPAKFMAALLSMQDSADKIDQYVKIARQMGIPILTPDINISNKDFVENNGSILYGLGSIKGVGESSIPELIANRPYASISDALEKVDKKFLNKRVGVSLIKAGAFDFESKNRFALLQEFYTLRKDKDEYEPAELYTREICMEMEKEVLGTPITYLPFWDGVVTDQTVEIEFELKKVQEKTDRNGNLMAFVDGVCDGCSIRAVVFSKTYVRNIAYFDMNFNTKIILKGKKDDKGALIVSSAKEYKAPIEESYISDLEGII